MIILDEEPSSKAGSYSNVAGPTLRFPERVAGCSTSALTLPDYETSQAVHSNVVYTKVVKSKADARFWRATLYALIIYIALSLIIGIPIVVTKLKQRSYQKYQPPPAPGPPWQASVEVSGPSSMNFEDLHGVTPACNSSTFRNDPSGNSYVASSQYNVSPRGEFSIQSNVSRKSDGPHFISGELTIGMNPNKGTKDAVLSLVMQASSSTLRKDTHICFTKHNDACDLSIYVPDNLSGSDSLQFNISLLFPQTDHPSTVDRLATWLPMFTQNFDHMDKQWTFSKATIEGPSSKFDAGYVQANNMFVQTSSAEIKGTFQVNESLTLDTVDAPIEAVIILLNDWKHDTPTFLTLDTGNGEIEADIRLHGPRPAHHHHTTFMTTIRTFNAQLNASITHDELTPPSEFYLRAMNYLAKSHITLDPKYEGTFELQTKLAKASVKHNGTKSVADPLGDGRKREFRFDHSSSTQIFGWVGWGSRPGPMTRQPHQGHVEIVSSHSSVLLELDGAGAEGSGPS